MSWTRATTVALWLATASGPIWAAPPKVPAPAPVVPPAVVEESPYDAAGRRDPFRPPRATSQTGEVVTPLQRYEIGQLRLVAVIYDTGNPRAVVEDDAGLGYIVRVGTPIGSNGGAVRSIERGRMLVRESSEDYFGGDQASEVVMELVSGDERGKR